MKEKCLEDIRKILEENFREQYNNACENRGYCFADKFRKAFENTMQAVVDFDDELHK